MRRVKYQHYYFNTDAKRSYYSIKSSTGRLIKKVKVDGKSLTKDMVEKMHQQDIEDDASNDRFSYHVAYHFDDLLPDEEKNTSDFNRILEDNKNNPEKVLLDQEKIKKL